MKIPILLIICLGLCLADKPKDNPRDVTKRDTDHVHGHGHHDHDHKIHGHTHAEHAALHHGSTDHDHDEDSGESYPDGIRLRRHVDPGDDEHSYPEGHRHKRHAHGGDAHHDSHEDHGHKHDDHTAHGSDHTGHEHGHDHSHEEGVARTKRETDWGKYTTITDGRDGLQRRGDSTDYQQGRGSRVYQYRRSSDSDESDDDDHDDDDDDDDDSNDSSDEDYRVYYRPNPRFATRTKRNIDSRIIAAISNEDSQEGNI